MRLRLTLLLLCALALPAYATDTALVDHDGVTQPLVLTPANLGAATAAQGATVDKVAGTVYLLADYASLQAAVDAASAAGGGTVLNAKGALITLANTFVPKTGVYVDLNGGTLKWGGAVGGTMVENDATTYGAKLTGMFNGKLDPGNNAYTVFKLHSIRSSRYGDLSLISSNADNLEFMHLYANAAADDPMDGVRNTVGNIFGPFITEAGAYAPVVKRVLTLEGFNDAGNWRGVTVNTFKGPWQFATKGDGIVFKQYCDSNIFEGMFQITLGNSTTPGRCVVFNDSSTPSLPVDVWGEHFAQLSCETWYPALAGQKAVEINHAGGIVIDYLGNDRVAQGSWPVGMVTDNYSQGHKITYVEGAPNYRVKEYIKGNIEVDGVGNGVTYPDGTTQTTAGLPASALVTSLGSPGSDSKVPSEKAVRSAIALSSSGLSDPGANGLVKRTSLNTSSVAGFADVVSLFGSGTCSGFLKNDGTCATGVGMVYPGSGVPVSTGSGWGASLNITGISDSTGTSSSTTAASSTAVKAAFDLANAKQSPATTLGEYGITDGVVSTGKAGGQTITGGTASGNSLTLNSTSNSNKGFIYLDGGPSHYYGAYGQLLLGTSSSLSGVYPSSRIHIVGENTTGSDDAGIRQEMYSTSSAFASIAGFRARGTYSSPLKVLNGDRFYGLAARGYYGVAGSGGAFPSSGTAAIFYNAEEDFNDSTHLGTRITFETTAPASGTRTEKLRIHGSGGVSIGNTTDPGASNLSVSGDVAAKTFTPTIPAATTYGATTTIDLSLGDSPSVTLTGNPTLAFSNPKAGQWHRLNIVQGASGGPYTVTWPSTGLVCTWRNTAGHTAPPLLAGAGAVDTIIIHTLSTTSAECWTAGNK